MTSGGSIEGGGGGFSNCLSLTTHLIHCTFGGGKKIYIDIDISERNLAKRTAVQVNSENWLVCNG